ncbi:hypothetical protein MLD38_018858 [Melastoma candidum]|uniref:Uncharacterized protein n=1 Tax=Melastoma candidum TaxID=119954 RepID=A0ACB9QW66_9MYRT|nr:hypothetical protein MLD38_018858 [Melastoma candidum]
MVLKGSINTHGKHWKGSDIVAFNAYLWWMTGLKMKVLGSLSPSHQKSVLCSSMMICSSGNIKHVVELCSVFFFMLYRSIDWGAEPGGNCYNQTTLIDYPSYRGSDCRKDVMRVPTEVFSKTRFRSC